MDFAADLDTIDRDALRTFGERAFRGDAYPL
jgi:hypothetical protein